MSYTNKEILNFETHFEKHIQAFLTRDTSADSIVNTLEQASFETPRIEVMFEVGEAIEPLDLLNTTSTEVTYRKYSGSLSLSIFTDGSTISVQEQTEAVHREIRSEVRASMMFYRQNMNIPTFVTVTGGGETSVAGQYTLDPDNLSEGRPIYKDTTETAHDLIYESGKWYIRRVVGSTNLYSVTTNEHIPPLDGYVSESGNDPIPSLSLSSSNKAPYYYTVKHVRPSGTTYETDGDLQMTQLTYDIVFSIRNDVLTSSYT